MVAGVCAGVARALGVDPTWVRLAVVALTVFGSGAGILLYAIGWAVLPGGPDRTAYVPVDVGGQTGDDGGWSPAGATGGAWVPVTARRRGRGGMVVGGILVALGVALLLSRLELGEFAWPVVLVGAGVALALGSVRR